MRLAINRKISFPGLLLRALPHGEFAAHLINDQLNYSFNNRWLKYKRKEKRNGTDDRTQDKRWADYFGLSC